MSVFYKTNATGLASWLFATTLPLFAFSCVSGPYPASYRVEGRRTTGADHWTLGFGGIFFEMRHATARAFKCAYVGQFAETLRSSNQSGSLEIVYG